VRIVRKSSPAARRRHSVVADTEISEPEIARDVTVVLLSRTHNPDVVVAMTACSTGAAITVVDRYMRSSRIGEALQEEVGGRRRHRHTDTTRSATMRASVQTGTFRWPGPRRSKIILRYVHEAHRVSIKVCADGRPIASKRNPDGQARTGDIEGRVDETGSGAGGPAAGKHGTESEALMRARLVLMTLSGPAAGGARVVHRPLGRRFRLSTTRSDTVRLVACPIMIAGALATCSGRQSGPPSRNKVWVQA